MLTPNNPNPTNNDRLLAQLLQQAAARPVGTAASTQPATPLNAPSNVAPSVATPAASSDPAQNPLPVTTQIKIQNVITRNALVPTGLLVAKWSVGMGTYLAQQGALNAVLRSAYGGEWHGIPVVAGIFFGIAGQYASNHAFNKIRRMYVTNKFDLGFRGRTELLFQQIAEPKDIVLNVKQMLQDLGAALHLKPEDNNRVIEAASRDHARQETSNTITSHLKAISSGRSSLMDEISDDLNSSKRFGSLEHKFKSLAFLSDLASTNKPKWERLINVMESGKDALRTAEQEGLDSLQALNRAVAAKLKNKTQVDLTPLEQDAALKEVRVKGVKARYIQSIIDAGFDNVSLSANQADIDKNESLSKYFEEEFTDLKKISARNFKARIERIAPQSQTMLQMIGINAAGALSPTELQAVRGHLNAAFDVDKSAESMAESKVSEEQLKQLLNEIEQPDSSKRGQLNPKYISTLDPEYRKYPEYNLFQQYRILALGLSKMMTFAEIHGGSDALTKVGIIQNMLSELKAFRLSNYEIDRGGEGGKRTIPALPVQLAMYNYRPVTLLEKVIPNEGSSLAIVGGIKGTIMGVFVGNFGYNPISWINPALRLTGIL